MRKEYDIEKLKIKRKGIHPKLSKPSLENSKVKVTISLDKSVVDFFKERSGEPGALPYQTQINQTLHAALYSSKTNHVIYEDLKKELLNDDTFVFSLIKILNQRKHITKKISDQKKAS